MAVQKIMTKPIDEIRLCAQKLAKAEKVNRHPYIGPGTIIEVEVAPPIKKHPFFSPSTPIGNDNKAKVTGSKIDFFAF